MTLAVHLRSALEVLRGREPFHFPEDAVPSEFRKAMLLEGLA